VKPRRTILSLAGLGVEVWSR